MTRQDDLERYIRESYAIIRQYEDILRTSDRPEEKARARRLIGEPLPAELAAAPLWDEEVVEAFIDDNGDGIGYVEIEINPLNTLLDINATGCAFPPTTPKIWPT